MSKRKQDVDDVNDDSEKKCKTDEPSDSSQKGSTFVVTVVNDSIQGMQEWTEEETILLKQAVDADAGQFNWDVIASSVPAKDINQVKAYVLSMVSQQQENQPSQSANVIKAPIEIWTDLAQKLTSDEDKAAAVCIPQEEIYAVQTELREAIAEQRSTMSKLFTSIRSMKKAVERTRRQTRRKLAEQNTKIDTLISLLGGSNTTATITSSSIIPLSKGKNNTSPKNQNNKTGAVHSQIKPSETSTVQLMSMKAHHIPTLAKNVVPLFNVSGAGDVELSPYSMVIIGQNPKVMLTRQQYSDAYFRGKNPRRFAVRLAEKVFSLDALSRSTVMGQQPGLERLCSEKLSAVRAEVLSRFVPTGTLDEREAKWKECLLSIGKKCQVLRSGKCLKEDIFNPTSSLSDSENLSFTSTKEETITSPQSTPVATVTLQVDEPTLQDGLPTSTQIDLIPLGGCSKVLIQREDLSEAVKRGKKATFLALRLAEKVFGYEVMVGSTVTGREGTARLDNEKLLAIKEEITRRFAADQPLELQEAIWKKCLYSISTKCKVLRASKPEGHELMDGSFNMDGGMCSAGAEVDDLELSANVTCPKQEEIDDEVVASSHGNHLAEEMTRNTEQQEEISMGQEEHMGSNEDHLAAEQATVVMEVGMEDVQGNVQTIELHQPGELCQHADELVQQDYV